MLLAYSKTRSTLLLDPVAGPGGGTLLGDLCKNRLPAGIRGWAGTATGGHIHVAHISHTHPPKELIQALRKYLLGKNIQSNASGPRIRKKHTIQRGRPENAEKKTYNPTRPARKSGKNLQFNRLCLVGCCWLLLVVDKPRRGLLRGQ